MMMMIRQHNRINQATQSVIVSPSRLIYAQPLETTAHTSPGETLLLNEHSAGEWRTGMQKTNCGFLGLYCDLPTRLYGSNRMIFNPITALFSCVGGGRETLKS